MALSRHTRLAATKHASATPVHHDDGLIVPKHQLADHGVQLETAYELISNELLLDGSSRLNLATFVTTWMPSIAAD